MGRICDLNLLLGIIGILVHRFIARFGNHPRPCYRHPPQNIFYMLIRLDRFSKNLAAF